MISLCINLVLYFVTIHRSGDQHTVYFRGYDKPLYIGYMTGDNTFTSGGPFVSSVNKFMPGDGCPCDGYFKPFVVARAIPTWQFFVNLILWAIPPSLYYLWRQKHENTRD